MSKKNPKVNLVIRAVHKDWSETELLPKTKVPLRVLWEMFDLWQPFTWTTASLFGEAQHKGHVHRREYLSKERLVTVWVVQEY